MCGRFVIAQDLDYYDEFFAVDERRTEPLPHSYNVAPTDPVYGVIERDDKRLLGAFRWGLIPYYAEDRRTIHINARLETVAEKPAFRTSFVRRRCLIPADGFYEWERRPDGSKQPHYITGGRRPLAFAGLWARWQDPETEEWIPTATIITTEAHPSIARIHDRMPVSLDESLWSDWLDPEQQDPATVMAILEANRPEALVDRTVSKMVNSVRNNSPELIDAI